MNRSAVLAVIGLTGVLAAAPRTIVGAGDAPPQPPNDIVGAIFEGLQNSGLVEPGNLELTDGQYRFTPAEPSAAPIEFVLDTDNRFPGTNGATTNPPPGDIFTFRDPGPDQTVGADPNGVWLHLEDGPGGQFYPGDLQPVIEVAANDLHSVRIGRLPRMIDVPRIGRVDTIDALFGAEGPVLLNGGPGFVVAPGTTRDGFGDDLIFFDIARGGTPNPGDFCEAGFFGTPPNRTDPPQFAASVPGDFFDQTSNQAVIQEIDGQIFSSSLEYANGGFPESGVPMLNVVNGNHVVGVMNADDFPSAGPVSRVGVFCSNNEGGAVDVIELDPGPVSVQDGLPQYSFAAPVPPPTTTTSTTTSTSTTTTTTTSTTTTTTTTTTTLAPVVDDPGGAAIADPPETGGGTQPPDDDSNNTGSIILFAAIALFGLAGIGYAIYLWSKKGGPCDELIDAWARAQQDCADKSTAAADAQKDVEGLQDRIDTMTADYEPLGFEDSGSSVEVDGETIDSIDTQLERWYRRNHPAIDPAEGPGTAEDATGTANRAQRDWAAQREKLRQEYDSNHASAQQLREQLEAAEHARDAADKAAKAACEAAEAARRAMQECLQANETPVSAGPGPTGGPSIATDPTPGSPCDPAVDSRPPEDVPPGFSRPRMLVDISVIVELDVGHGNQYEAERIAQGFDDLSTVAAMAGNILSGAGASKSAFKGNYGSAGAQVAGTHEDIPSIPTSIPQLGAEYAKFTTKTISRIAKAAGGWAKHNSSYKIKLVQYHRSLVAKRVRVWECVDGAWRCRLEAQVEWGPLQRTSRYVGGIVLGADVEKASKRWLTAWRANVARGLKAFDTWTSQNPPGECG